MMPLTIQDDKDLLSRLKRGDHNAFQELYCQYAPVIYSRLKKLIHHQEWVEELHQEVFLKVWENRAKINDDVPFQAILFRTAKSLAIDFYRKAIRDKKMQEQLIDIVTEYYVSDPSFEDSEINKSLYCAIEKLPPQRKRVFSLIKLEGKRYEEVAKELDISLSTVKDHMAKAMAFLRDELTKKQLSLLLSTFLMEIYKVFS
ncbi:RNA polymerase sigma factor [Sphingobacterium pedocola]|uniref:RNA polymerase sigma-70 factor n=1 Tax=Sphingobacterium pedocola TaxID=2082722 RepID=A0ABR9T890_9SPHI|nr:RNA polymerase sigma-70 factor [Sphingobacterium pedocola]MBE8721550.1 RNA polymerase sigma-70 factor [Sphingobacterium pedocola]